eukprot:gb/GECH01010287.1/.p1 GENE.gb/GECH01010287.1/~~gb/GECH01010287.1/.p1  ORF type:complete len:379 (+),score=89.35 gb/GECH01010287.1/:1-1137(+)
MPLFSCLAGNDYFKLNYYEKQILGWNKNSEKKNIKWAIEKTKTYHLDDLEKKLKKKTFGQLKETIKFYQSTNEEDSIKSVDSQPKFYDYMNDDILENYRQTVFSPHLFNMLFVHTWWGRPLVTNPLYNIRQCSRKIRNRIYCILFSPNDKKQIIHEYIPDPLSNKCLFKVQPIEISSKKNHQPVKDIWNNPDLEQQLETLLNIFDIKNRPAIHNLESDDEKVLAIMLSPPFVCLENFYHEQLAALVAQAVYISMEFDDLTGDQKKNDFITFADEDIPQYIALASIFDEMFYHFQIANSLCRFPLEFKRPSKLFSARKLHEFMLKETENTDQFFDQNNDTDGEKKKAFQNIMQFIQQEKNPVSPEQQNQNNPFALLPEE